MKTGSTAFQDLLRINKRRLADRQIFWKFYAPAANFADCFPADLAQAVSDRCKGMVLTSEFFGHKHPEQFQRAMPAGVSDRLAILTHRPLRDLYVSLYLQHLKGPGAFTTDFEDWISRQADVDRTPAPGKGVILNFGFLEANMRAAGFDVLWRAYDRAAFLASMVDAVQAFFDIPDLFGPDLSLSKRPPQGLSPRRSLHMATAGAAREINLLVEQGLLSQEQRSALLVELLGISQWIPEPSQSLVHPDLLAQLERLDVEMNGAFYDSLGGAQ